MNESLLREIIIRVLADPQFQPLLATAGSPAAKGDCLIIVENREGLAAVPALQRRWGREHSLRLCVAGPLGLADGALPQVSWEEAVSNQAWVRIFLPVISGRQLSAIALGLSLDKISEAAGWAIRQGISLTVGRVDYGFSERTPDAYRALIAGYAKQVAAYGVTVGDGADEPPAEAPAPAAAKAPDRPETPWTAGEPVGARAVKAPDMRPTVSFEQRLFSEKEAILLPKHAVLLIAKATVLTPSAIDVLKKQKVEVYREGVRYL